jgi:ribA/ribD-fused uncharacterized protein
MAVDFYTHKFYVFDNFSAHAVEFDGQLYPTAEAAYQAAKCTDPKGKEEIRNARSPRQAKVLANEVYKAAKDPAWGSKKAETMEKILRAKLAQHSEVAEVLAQSGNEDIVEGSPVDYFWGAGIDGSGQNMLGKLWMKIRAEHRKSITHSS